MPNHIEASTTAPGRDEITAALAVLRRIPGVTDGHCLEDIAEISTPLVQLGYELRAWLDTSTQTPDVGQIIGQLTTIAGQHGLHIVDDPADPGEPIGYISLVPRDGHYGRGWRQSSDHLWRTDQLDEAETYARASGETIAGVHLLREGGQR